MRPESGPTSTRRSPWTRRKVKMKADGRHSEDKALEVNCWSIRSDPHGEFGIPASQKD